jgi:aspartyl-tRNA(Asn)/glutamyl-tRNA(Gln) amidotransferase subunit A
MSAHSGIESASMLKSASNLSRRSFLGTALGGSAGYLFSVERWTRTETAVNLNSPAAATSSDLTNLNLHEVASMIKAKKISPVEITRACLARIEQLNPSLNAFITITADSAMVQARQAESEVQRGEWRGPLHGIPIALKDLIDTAGVRTTAASALFKDRIPEEDATVVRLLRNAGAVLLGKLNMHEFAYGGTSATSYFGRVSNPWNHEYITGGSSGGSAAAVAAGLCYGALGSDTGGSIRQPAACCGIVGLKPTYGRVSTRGVIPLSWSADHIGPMTRSVEDAAILLQAIAGYDASEVTSYDKPVEDYAAATNPGISALRIGVPRDFFYAGLDSEIKEAVEQALAVLEKLGTAIRDIKMEVSSDRTVIRSEAYAYHSENVAKHPELYLPETLAKLRMGASIDTATYIKAHHQIEQLRREIPKLFAAVDVLVTPTTPVPPSRIEELPADFDKLLAWESVMFRNTRPFNLSGLPTISVPCGFTKTGLPIGLQISGAPWRESVVLRLAHAYQQATSWHLQHPVYPAESHT